MRAGACLFGLYEGACGFAIRPGGGHGHEVPLGVAQGRELAAEDAAGVDIDRPVEPVGLGHRRVAVDNHCLAPVLRCPVEADGQPELVGFACRLAVEGEVPDLCRASALHLLLHPRVSDDQLAIVEDKVADETVEELGEVVAEGTSYVARQVVDLGERIGQPVRDLDVLASELLQQLHIMVAGDAQGRTPNNHVPHQPHGVEDAGAAVHEVAEEDRPARPRGGRTMVLRPGRACREPRQ